ncbi:hypothetical protein J3454_10270 [Erythrobacter sp. NFXS35]
MMVSLIAAPLAAQDDTAATPPAAEAEPGAAEPSPSRVNLTVTVPRGEVN